MARYKCIASVKGDGTMRLRYRKRVREPVTGKKISRVVRR